MNCMDPHGGGVAAAGANIQQAWYSPTPAFNFGNPYQPTLRLLGQPELLAAGRLRLRGTGSYFNIYPRMLRLLEAETAASGVM